ncbi:uncharacterized protein LOC121869902 [Homarus americanus]|uniref:Uncharacterized protein n=1 Tax=Homarus americanus TaxID=6706 RepID=A0A8J5MW89_HOMAM|nr:uncharacterized protein LOC121869902 [Homarus americanus]KAG7165966.1 hypothetical protein Hamer_G011885 [Homarus americanus]
MTEVPADGPTWTGVLSAYHVNQQLHAHCQVFGSRPPAVFTFFLNDHRITDEDGWVMKHKPSRNTRDMIWNSSSTLSIHLNSESIKTLFPKSLPQYHSYILQETRRNMSSGNPKSNIHYRLQWQEPYSSHDAAPYSNNPFTPPYTHTHSERRSAHESLYSLSSISPIASSYSRPSSVARDLYSSLPSKNQKINLTCVANIGGLSLKTSTWTLLSFPTELHFSSKSRLSENSGPTLAPSPCLQAITVLCLTVNAGFKGFLLNLARYD